MASLYTQKRLNTFSENMGTTLKFSVLPLTVIYSAFAPRKGIVFDSPDTLISNSTWTKILTVVASPLLVSLTALTFSLGLTAGLLQAAILPLQLAYSTYKDSQIPEELRFDGYEIGSKEGPRREKKSSSESLSKLSRPAQASVTAKLSHEAPEHYAPLFANNSGPNKSLQPKNKHKNNANPKSLDARG